LSLHGRTTASRGVPSAARHASHRFKALARVGAISALALLAVPVAPHAAVAAAVSTDNGCQNNIQAGTWSQIGFALEATAPSAATAGTAVSITGLKVTAQLSAAYIQAGVGLGLLHDGQTINGSAKVTIHATNATPADAVLTGNGSGTVAAPGGTAQPLSVTVSLGNQQWTPSTAGTMTLAEAAKGTISHTGVPAPTDGSVELDAALLHATNDTFIVCKPGTVNAAGTTFTPAASVAPFLSVAVDASSGSTTTTAPGATTTTAPSSTTTVAGGTTTTTAVGATTSTSSASVASGSGGSSGTGSVQQSVTVNPVASTATTAASRVLGESISRASTTGLARTGSTRDTLLLALAGLVLVDLGYLAFTATKPGRGGLRRREAR
jgi:hypothetical protein